jgi:hypothetical protein
MPDHVCFSFQIKIKSEETSSLISSYGVKGWQAMLYLVSFTAIPALMLLGTLLTWIGKPIGSLNGMLTWFFLPCFILFVTLSWCIVALFGSTAVMISGKSKHVCFPPLFKQQIFSPNLVFNAVFKISVQAIKIIPVQMVVYSVS